MITLILCLLPLLVLLIGGIGLQYSKHPDLKVVGIVMLVLFGCVTLFLFHFMYSLFTGPWNWSF